MVFLWIRGIMFDLFNNLSYIHKFVYSLYLFGKCIGRGNSSNHRYIPWTRYDVFLSHMINNVSVLLYSIKRCICLVPLRGSALKGFHQEGHYKAEMASDLRFLGVVSLHLTSSPNTFSLYPIFGWGNIPLFGGIICVRNQMSVPHQWCRTDIWSLTKIILQISHCGQIICDFMISRNSVLGAREFTTSRNPIWRAC